MKFQIYIVSLFCLTCLAAGEPATKPTTQPAAYTLAKVEFDDGSAFGAPSLTLTINAAKELEAVDGAIVFKTLRGQTLGTITVNQEVKGKSFTVQIEYDKKADFLVWLKTTPVAQIAIDVDQSKPVKGAFTER